MKKYIISILALTFILLISSDVYSATEDEKLSLIGAVPIRFAVSVKEIGNLTENQIKNDVELKLLQSGIKIDSNSRNILLIFCRTMENNEVNNLGVFSVDLDFFQDVTLKRNKLDMIVSTYHLITWGFIDVRKAQGIRSVIKDLIDEFIIDYLKANPKK